MAPVERGSQVRKTFWLDFIILFVMAAWYCFDLANTLLFATQSWGFLPGLLDAVFILRLGEVLITLPLLLYLLLLRREAGYLKPVRWLMLAGALLAAISFLGLYGRIGWAPLAPAIAIIGLLAALAAGLRGGWLVRFLAWLGLALLLVSHLLLQAAGFLFYGYPTAPYPASYPARAASQAERQQQDARYLTSELAGLHMNAYHTRSQQQYWEEAGRLEAGAASLSEGELALEMMRFVAGVGDGHTRFQLQGQTELHSLPVDFAWYGDDLHVRGISPDYPQAVGARVLMIGGLTAEQAYQAVLPYISHENDSWARVQSEGYLNLVELLAAVGAVDQAGPVTLRLETHDQEVMTVEVAPLEPGETVDYLSAGEAAPFYLSRPEEPFWYEYRESSGTLYFRYAACIDMTGFRKMANELWELAEEKPVERLIIDLRGNGGGNTLQFDRFFAPRLRAHPELDDPQRLFVLIDRRTFSSASDHAADLSVSTYATLVGEPTGGKPNSYGEVRSFRLPNSRWKVYYSTKYFQAMEIDPPSIEPDVLIYAPAAEVYAGQDPVLAYAAPDEEW